MHEMHFYKFFVWNRYAENKMGYYKCRDVIFFDFLEIWAATEEIWPKVRYVFFSILVYIKLLFWLLEFTQYTQSE